jgi:quercetin dioxygenase-like cupin family protein
MHAAGSEALTVVMENEHVRVLRYQSKPGHVVAMHTHPGPQVYVALSDFKRKITRPEGSVRELGGKFGDVLWVPDGTPHQGEDTGAGTHFVIVELKDTH